jgi:lycopene cyclase CruP
MLSTIFQDMAQLGDPVLKPFLQDVVQFPALFQTLTKTALSHPSLVLKVIPQVGVPALMEWLGHYASLASYAAAYPAMETIAPFLTSPLLKNLPPRSRYRYHRWLDALKYGSGRDY